MRHFWKKNENSLQDYVETTMNELLGWYGLPKIDKGDTPNVSLNGYPAHLSMTDQQSPPPMAAGALLCHKRKHLVPKSSPPDFDASNVNLRSEDCRRRSAVVPSSLPSPVSGEDKSGKHSNDTNNNNSSGSGGRTDDEEDDADLDDPHQLPVSDDTGDEMDNMRDSPSVRSDVSGMISPLGGITDSDRGTFIICSWCQKPGTKLFTLGTPTGVKAFCSEICFTQCRRASFKKKKVCDWCKHVRHTVNFVDFQEGDVQLQFCSEKCLNQYKMNIFCTEARQHLQHIQNIVSEEDKRGESKGELGQGELLITPELWLSANSNESNVSVKEEVDDEKCDKGNERHSERAEAYTKMDDEEEPGELRDKGSALDGNSRLTHSDDSSCSFEERVLPAPVPMRLHRAHTDLSHLASTHLQRHEDIHNKGGDSRPRKDFGKCRKSFSDNKPRSGSADPSSSHTSRKDKPPFPHRPPAEVAPSFGGLQTSGEALATHQPLLPEWASLHLLSMMPPHLNAGLNIGYASNPLLYSSLFGANPLPGQVEKDNQAKLRHESRRELLRDRDRYTNHNDRRHKSREKPTGPLSPSTSLSSTDTPGPAGATGPARLPTPSAIPSNVFTDMTRQFPHVSPFIGEASHTNPLSQYYTNSALPGMLPFSLPFNQPQNLRTGLPTPAATTAPHPPSTSAHHPQAPLPPQPPLQFSGVPPITVMVPYPVAVPIPLPVPIPIPISPEKLFAYFREKSESAKTAKHKGNASHQRTTSPEDTRQRAASANHMVSPLSALSPRPTSKCSSLGGVPLVATPSMIESPEPGLMLTGRESTDSIMTLRREISRSQLKAASTSPCSSSARNSMMSPGVAPYMLDLSKGACRDSPCNEDEAMDLSKMSSRSDSPRRSTDSSEKENNSSNKRGALSDAGGSRSDIKVPRIHIVSQPPDPPLTQPSACTPLPPELSTYSSRRSRILDAPSVPKKSRSPSPERRYIRTVPRDMVEAARRRGLRARVRSK
ncbi:sine oculis-binding protein homolog isoform X2 [Biomphalaria glabrata]|uniref:Sine oculis-binding protein homolog isoform X2 n=1 Tax=Biomphalaria glabrata TaxID=6526 RepID=A0A9W3ANI1_BIOGL|nr:sine oculis-binding protein homolog isoform X2 [Biomphalaria glabrata]